VEGMTAEVAVVAEEITVAVAVCQAAAEEAEEDRMIAVTGYQFPVLENKLLKNRKSRKAGKPAT